MSKRTLETYLKDHLAGAAYAVQLLGTCIEEHPEHEAFFVELRADVQEDREILRSILLRIGGEESRIKSAGAWAMEKVSRIKHSEPSDASGSSLLERLESLSLGIEGKRSLWQSLDAISGGGGRFGGLSLAELTERAEEQYDRVEERRLRQARDAFLRDVPDVGRSGAGVGAEAAGGESDEAAAGKSGEEGSKETPRLEGVLLDLDGTLIDTNDAHARAWAEAFEEAGRAVPFEVVRPLIGMGGDKIIPALTDLDPESEEGSSLSRRCSEIFLRRHLGGCRPFAGVRQLLERLRAEGLGLTVVTSAKAEEMERILDQAGVDDLVERSTTASEVEDSKPEPDVIEAGLEKSGWDPEEAILLGDTPFDVEAGRAAGVDVVAVRCGGSGQAELAGAVAVYADPAELLAEVDRSPFGRGRGAALRIGG